MIRVSVLYPAGPSFDMDYYLSRHTPMVRSTMGTALKGLTIDHVAACIAPGGAPPYQVICTLQFERMESMQAVLAEGAGPIMADIPNFTATQPVIVAGEAKASKRTFFLDKKNQKTFLRPARRVDDSPTASG